MRSNQKDLPITFKTRHMKLKKACPLWIWRHQNRKLQTVNFWSVQKNVRMIAFSFIFLFINHLSRYNCCAFLNCKYFTQLHQTKLSVVRSPPCKVCEFAYRHTYGYTVRKQTNRLKWTCVTNSRNYYTRWATRVRETIGYKIYRFLHHVSIF